MKNIYLLGAAGSIGTQTLEILENNADFKVIGLSLSRDDQKNFEILKKFSPEIGVIRNKRRLKFYRTNYPNTKWYYGDRGLIKIAKYQKPGLLINALSGSSGLKPTIAAIKAKKDIGLANKETLVMAGKIVNKLVKKHGVKLLPIDSEHFAIAKLIEKAGIDQVDSIIITASGGSFRNLNRKALTTVSKEDALKHPTWKMGPKITIDSATMVNKGLEIIEAHHLFGLPYQKISALIHQESQVHGIIKLKNGEVRYFSSPNDMKIPIRQVLYYPKPLKCEQAVNIKNLHFSELDVIRYPMYHVAYYAGISGGIIPTVYNAANEAAVNLFLEGKISFLEIESIVIKYTLSTTNRKNPSLAQILRVDKKVKAKIKKEYAG